jgi:hypothetical protein
MAGSREVQQNSRPFSSNIHIILQLVMAEHRGMGHDDSPHFAALVDYMEVAGWIEEDPGADPIVRGE